jgi:hypothetical protein
MKRGADLDPLRTGEPVPKRLRKSPVSYYGQLGLVEQLDDTGDASAGQWVVNLDCFSAGWFDGLRDDLADLPEWNTVAQVAQSRTIEFTEPAVALLQRLTPAFGNLGGPLDALGRWLKFSMVVDTFQSDGFAVELYVPPSGASDPAFVVADGDSVPGARLLTVEAPDNGAQLKLDALTALYSPEG